jgi:hypothetical protein
VKPKQGISADIFGNIQLLLETRRQEAYDIASKFQKSMHARQGRGLIPLQDREISEALQQSFCPQIYHLVAETLLELIPLVQRDECEQASRINFYFWPGYHSALMNRRIFANPPDVENKYYGIGFLLDLRDEDPKEYFDAYDVRWYHHLARLCTPPNIAPGDLHTWYRYQQPRGPSWPRSPVSSLTVIASEHDPWEWQRFQDHQILDLSSCLDRSEDWGTLLSDKLNGFGSVTDPSWRFPGRRGENPEQAALFAPLRSKVAGIWLHTVFHNNQPPWLKTFVDELLSDSNTRPAGEALEAALNDDALSNCRFTDDGSCFKSWTHLALYPSLAPVPPAMFPMRPISGPADPKIDQTVGSAAFLCSVPLGPVFVSLAHAWVSTVYDLIRNVEVAILLNNHQIEAASTGMLAGPWWAHELKKLIDEGLPILLREASESTLGAKENRYFVLNSIRTMGDLAFAYANGTLSRDHESMRKQRESLIKPLRLLRDSGNLNPALRYVAGHVYRMVNRTRGGRINFSEPDPPGFDLTHLTDEQHRSCLLFVEDAIRSYCQAADPECVANWSATCKGDLIEIRLAGRIKAEHFSSMACAQLDFLMTALEIGHTEVPPLGEKGSFSYLVRIQLNPWVPQI